MKKLSVVTVCYNSEKYIGNCIGSLLSQLTDEVEYLIIDGASEDRTLDIISELTEGCDVRVSSEPDGGIYDAMNKGLAKATGKFIYYLNSDDSLKPDAIGKLLDAIDRYPDADCIYGNVEVCEEDENGVSHPVKIWYGDPDLSGITEGMVFSHQGVICRCSAMREIGGFWTGLKIAADWDLLLRLYRKGCTFQHTDILFGTFSRGGVSCHVDHDKERHLVRKRNHCYRLIDKEYLAAKKTRLHDKIKK